MAKKKSIITSILQTDVPEWAASFFAIGGHPLKKDGQVCLKPDSDEPAFPEVSAIKFSRYAFGEGAAVDQPCYSIEFDGTEQKVIIPASKFAQITLAVEEKDNNNNVAVPAMPE